MKKTYIIPEITIHKLEVMNLLAGSPNAPLGGKADDSTVLSRHRGDWDEDEEDDW